VNKKQTYKILLRSSGIIILILILLKVDIEKVLEGLKNINFIIYSPLFLIFIAHSYVKSQRWKLILVNSRINITGNKLFFIYVASFLPGAITPGRIGEIIKYKMLKNKELDQYLGFTLSLQDRIWDVSFTALIGSVFFLYVLNNVFYSMLILPCLVLFIFASMRPESVVRYIGIFLSRVFPETGYIKKMIGLSKNIVPLSKKNLLLCLILTITSWVIYFVQVYVLFSATGIRYSFIFVFSVTSAAGLVALLPISIAGIGTRDLALVGLFSLSGKSSEDAIVLSFCMLMIFFANCIISLPFWMNESNSLAMSIFD